MSLLFAVSNGVCYQSEVMNSKYVHLYLSDYFSDNVSSSIDCRICAAELFRIMLMFNIVIIVPEFRLLEKFADIIGCLIDS